jgi:RimJ/RimL family protein N-acetyltransferase
VPVRLRQEVQEVPRRLTPPEPQLADDAIRLEPLAASHAPEFGWALGDPDIIEFTRVPSDADPDFLETWLGRYEAAWADGSRAGFAIRPADGGAVIGFASYVSLDLDGRQGEIGYALAPEGRGRGAATRSVDLLTRWGFDELELMRIELWIDVRNEASARVAERCGYRLDGVLRSVHFKEGRRQDFAIWSRLASD